ncbi:Spastin, partial [Gryllus bimaculatus]
NIQLFLTLKEEKNAIEKKRHILSLISGYLKDEGLFQTAKCLSIEASVVNSYEVCDNIDLPTILREYESYYYARFQKYPKICKKVEFSVKEKDVNISRKKNGRKITSREATDCIVNNVKDSQGNKNLTYEVKEVKSVHDELSAGLTVQPVNLNNTPKVKTSNECEDFEENGKFLKPLDGINGFCSEWKEFAECISKEICVRNPNVQWNDIIGLQEAKKLLKEAVVYPIKYPELFSGILAPWKGLLLYGPPGTGKTLLAKAVATKCKTTFFNISASSIVSKWRGDSEKLVRVLFELARYHAPSTIFLDEIDAVASHRDGSGEHEGSKRLKAELLIQLDGLLHSNDKVFLLATSNLPWELDTAILRRLEKRILVDLPSPDARKCMFQHYLPPVTLNTPNLECDLNYDHLAQITEGYSGSDIKLVCKETVMEAMRSVFSVLENYDDEASFPKLELKKIITDDVEQALKRTKPSAAHVEIKYRKWQKEFGSV